MTKGAIASTITGTLIFAGLCVSGVLFLFSLVLALNGYMGQERAVNASFITYIILAVVTGLIVTGLGAWLAYYLTERRKWHGVGSAALAMVLAIGVGAGLHLASVVVAAVVADQMRTNKK
jgi:hypothetical protein